MDGAYLLFGIFVAYLFTISYMSWNGSRATRERKKLSEAVAGIEQQYKRGNHAAVVEKCQEKLSIYPNDVGLHWYLALAAYAMKDFGTSRDHFRRVADLDPRYETDVQCFLRKIEQEWTPRSIE